MALQLTSVRLPRMGQTGRVNLFNMQARARIMRFGMLATFIASFGLLGCGDNKVGQKAPSPASSATASATGSTTGSATKSVPNPEVYFVHPEVEGNVCDRTLNWEKEPLKQWKDNPEKLLNTDTSGGRKVTAWYPIETRTSPKYSGWMVKTYASYPSVPRYWWILTNGFVNSEGEIRGGNFKGTTIGKKHWEEGGLGLIMSASASDRGGNYVHYRIRFYEPKPDGGTSWPDITYECRITFDTFEAKGVPREAYLPRPWPENK